MKIAFVSCVDPIDDGEQPVWNEVAAQNPDVLLLLGDNVYMDFSYPALSNHPLYCSLKWSDQRFADELYRRYLIQSEVPSFRNLVSNIHTIGTTWDDHDFAWNNSHGSFVDDGSNSGELNKHHVPLNKRKISKYLHLQFRNWLRSETLPDSYPEQPSLNDMLAIEDSGIEELIEVDNTRIFMLDGRYYREPKKDDLSTQILGDQQRNWLSQELSSSSGIKLICSGTTLSRGGEGWDHYSDLAWLAQCDLSNTVILSGDIHRNAIKRHKYLNGVFEATSSGAARPHIGGDTGNFGILEISGTGAKVWLHDDDEEDENADWNSLPRKVL